MQARRLRLGATAPLPPPVQHPQPVVVGHPLDQQRHKGPRRAAHHRLPCRRLFCRHLSSSHHLGRSHLGLVLLARALRRNRALILALCLGLGPWLAAEVPHLVATGVVAPQK